jgi:ferric-dicitrate binding protein FerR (iron transport regulator)
VSLADREEAQTRELLAGLGVPTVPAHLAADAERAGRALRRRRARLRRAGWVLLCCAALAFAVWAARARPWTVPEEVTTPPYRW